MSSFFTFWYPASIRGVDVSVIFEDSGDVLETFCVDILNGNAVCLAGAGISMIAPSKLPSGKALRDLITAAIIEKSTPYFSFSDFEKNDKYQSAIPEVLFGDYYRFLGARLYRPFSLLSLAESNSVHRTLAHLNVSFGLPVFTTNFETMIEDFHPDAKVWHLHGSLSRPEAMFIRINQITATTLPPHAARMRHFCGKTLYVFGYSGNDRDIMNAINQAEFKKISWMLRRRNDIWTTKNLTHLAAPVAPFVTEARSFVDDAASKLSISASSISTFKKCGKSRSKIIRDFHDAVRPFESICIGAFLAYRIQEYLLAHNALKKAVTDKRLTKHQRGRLALYLVETGRGAGIDKDELIVTLEAEITKQREGILLGEIINILGILHLDAELYQQAEPYFRKAEAIFFEISRRKSSKSRSSASQLYSFTLNNIGLCKYNLKDFYGAYRYLFKSYLIKKRSGHMLGVAAAYLNLSTTALLLGNESKHEQWDKRAQGMIKQYAIHNRHATYRIDLAEAYIFLNRPDDAEAQLTKAEQIIRDHIATGFFESARLRKIETEVAILRNGSGKLES